MEESKDKDYRTLSYNVLRDDAFILVNKKFLSILGIKATIYLSALISKEKYFFNRGLLADNQL